MTFIKTILPILSLVFALHTSAQPLRYLNTVFDAVDTLKNVEYATAPWLSNPIDLLKPYSIHDGEFQTENRPLLMDIFMPKNDTIAQRPAILFLHGGAFLLGTRHNDDMVAFCDSFARRGYVTATIDYRIGMGADVSRFFGIPVSVNIEESSSKRALYRATQDSRAAVRFLKYNAEIYGIDTTRIFMAGSSAGGFVCLNNLYLNPHEVTPDVLETPSPGGLDSIGIPGYGGQAEAVVSMWGAMENTKLIENDTTPVFLIHGKADDIVPFKKGIPLDGIVPQNPLISFNISEAYGSFCIDTALNKRGILHETYFVENKGHEVYGADTGEFGENGPNQYWDTIHWRISSFFFDRFKPDAEFDYIKNKLAVKLLNTSSQTDYSLWDFGDGTLGFGILVFHNYTKPGIYQVQLTTCNQNMACDTFSRTVTISLTNSAETIAEKTKIFPNPVSGRLKVTGINRPFNVLVYNLTGQVQFIKKDVSSNFIDVGQLKNGVYLLEIKTENVSVLKRFVKIH